METKQFESTTGFVIYDLPDAEAYVGPARLGAKLVPGNAVMLARHQTYVFAILEQRRSGATIGFKVDPDAGADAIAAAADELGDQLAAGTLLTSPGLRLDGDALEPFLRHDPRNPALHEDRDGITLHDELLGVGAAATAGGLRGGLDGASVAIEGFDAAGLGLAREVVAQGGTVTRIATAKGCVSGSFDPATLADAWLAAGPSCVEQLGEVGKPWEIWKSDVDVVFVGSKPGAMSGEGASSLANTPVVATSAAAISSKALALLRQNGAPTASDFVASVGPALAWWADEGTSAEDLRALTATTVGDLMNDTADHADGAFMASCYKAEAFLGTWQATLPFGRPLG